MMFAFGSLCWRGAQHVSVPLKISRMFYEGKRSKNADCYGFSMDTTDVAARSIYRKIITMSGN
jgi:hypothetical protein